MIGATPVRGERAPSIDVLRGLAMAGMLLDHVRLLVHLPVDPTDLERTTIPLFLTRWITHFCAPAFVLLAGVSARIRASRSGAPGETSRFLALRGLWLRCRSCTPRGSPRSSPRIRGARCTPRTAAGTRRSAG